MAAYYMIGDPVEVIGSEQPFLGSFYEATIVGQAVEHHYEVEYLTIFDITSGQKLRDTLPACKLRGSPLIGYQPRYNLGDKCEVWNNSGWWIGQVTTVRAPQGKYEIYLPLAKREVEGRSSVMRPRPN